MIGWWHRDPRILGTRRAGTQRCPFRGKAHIAVERPNFGEWTLNGHFTRFTRFPAKAPNLVNGLSAVPHFSYWDCKMHCYWPVEAYLEANASSCLRERAFERP